MAYKTKQEITLCVIPSLRTHDMECQRWKHCWHYTYLQLTQPRWTSSRLESLDNMCSNPDWMQ